MTLSQTSQNSPVMNIDRLMRRHLEFAIRARDTGQDELALRIALTALNHEPPTPDSPLLYFLVQSVLLPAVSDGSSDHRALRSLLTSDRELRRSVRWWLRFYFDQGCDTGRWHTETEGKVSQADVDELMNLLQEKSGGEPVSAGRTPLLSGCTNGVIVEHSGQARLVRVHARIVHPTDATDARVVGCDAPGTAEAVSAARHYLRAAGCDPIDEHRVELLIEGLFHPVVGESLALPVFLAVVSAMLRIPAPADWAFTGAVGSPTIKDAVGLVMPVDELRAKLAACSKAGFARLVVPAYSIPDHAVDLEGMDCRLVRTRTTAEAVEMVLPDHRLPEQPRNAEWHEVARALLRTAVWPKFAQTAGRYSSRHRLFLAVVPLFFALMLTERWWIAEYLIPEHYAGVDRPPVWLAAVLGCVAVAIMVFTMRGCLQIADQLMNHNALANWYVTAGLLLCAFVLASLSVQPIIRDPLAPPPRGLYFEHRTFQWCKDTVVLYLYALIFFIGPYTRIRLTERAASTGRLRWAREILKAQRWTTATLPMISLGSLILIASVAIMGLGSLDWLSLTDGARTGAAPQNGPWRAIHILGRAVLLVVSCATVLWWLARSTQQAAKAPNTTISR